MYCLATTTHQNKYTVISDIQKEKFSHHFYEHIKYCKNFQEYLDTFCEPISLLVNDILPKCCEENINTYLLDPLSQFFENHGKCSRPLVCLLSNYAFGGDIKKCITSAVSIEVFQNAALIHDDIADAATTRRNKECIHIKIGLPLALNAGDFALSQVDEIVLSDKTMSNDLKIKVLSELSKMKLSTIEGQALDIGWSNQHKFDLTIDNYTQMATLKTANYTFATPITIGAIIAGESDETISSLRSFGINCGLAFQIKDDIENVDRNIKKSPKDFALDIASGKRTLIAIHTINTLPKQNRDEFIKILDKKTNTIEEINLALDLIENTGSIEFANKTSQELIEKAKCIISSCSINKESKHLLESIPDWCQRRNY